MNISIFETLEHYLLAHEVGLVRAGDESLRNYHNSRYKDSHTGLKTCLFPPACCERFSMISLDYKKTQETMALGSWRCLE